MVILSDENVGDGHPKWPCTKPNYAYSVLDYFHITDMWMEKKPGSDFSAFKVRFEKADLTQLSWWATKTAQDEPMKTPVKQCSVCGKTSKEIFIAGWTCLTFECSEYFRIGAQADLKYTEQFLAERSVFTGTLPPLLPALPDLTNTHGTEELCRRGVVCAKCGCCVSRRHWKGWVCLNPGCDWELSGSMRPLPAAIVNKDETAMDIKVRKRRHMNSITPDIDGLATILHEPSSNSPQCVGMVPVSGYQVYQYLLPDNEGIIIGSFSLFVASDEVKTAEGGPDSLLADVEQVELGLRRNPAAVANSQSQPELPACVPES